MATGVPWAAADGNGFCDRCQIAGRRTHLTNLVGKHAARFKGRAVCADDVELDCHYRILVVELLVNSNCDDLLFQSVNYMTKDELCWWSYSTGEYGSFNRSLSSMLRVWGCTGK